ncbi:cysteine-rich CWC family protein [Vibrio sp. HN007]|uniref:cysteine-rich CWC family protein n=1 Tax=Vibrio iocasae TaxID=3098914 RepID=UPI0035D4AFC4
MRIDGLKPDPSVCPLCGQKNDCLNLGVTDTKRRCWCNDSAIKFSEALLAKVPKKLLGKACICRACVLRYQDKNSD